MGGIFGKFKESAKKSKDKVVDVFDEKVDYGQEDNVERGVEENGNRDDDYFGRSPIPQRSKSFHWQILANKYTDLELSIRGLKTVYDKKTKKTEIKRRDYHCFTDEEAETIIRMAQAHLGADIKLANFTETEYKIKMDIIYHELVDYFRNVAEYRYGRYKSYENQLRAKLDNKAILVELYHAIRANYSRAIKGTENRRTHEGVGGQENLNDKDDDINNSGYH